MVHWAQGVRRKVEDQPKFAKYDYGQACVDSFGNAQPCNQAMYGSEEPPVYDLKAIKTPLAIFSGTTNLPNLYLELHVCYAILCKHGHAILHDYAILHDCIVASHFVTLMLDTYN